FICLTSNHGRLSDIASHVVPVSAWTEMDGTFVNGKGLHQRFKRAVPPPRGVEPAWSTLVRFARTLGISLPYQTIEDVRADLARGKRTPSARPSAGVLGS